MVLPTRPDRVAGRMPGDLEQQLARQRIAVGVQAGGGQAEQHVAGTDLRAGEQALALDRADDEAGQIVFAGGVEAGHLGGLAADQRAAVGPAAAGDAGDHFGGDARVQLSDGEIIQEEQRRSRPARRCR